MSQQKSEYDVKKSYWNYHRKYHRKISQEIQRKIENKITAYKTSTSTHQQINKIKTIRRYCQAK